MAARGRNSPGRGRRSSACSESPPPDARGRGVGLALVRWCLERARASGARELVLSSATSMRAAHRLYIGLGFTRRPALDWSPMPGLDLLGFGVVLDPPSANGGR
jgi:hypothetical protein